jgi:hypothetical protein
MAKSICSFCRAIFGERSGVLTEVSYLSGEKAVYGTSGGVRLDVVLGSVQDPAAVFDFKTGMAQLTPSRVEQIKQHLPPQSVNIPIYDIWP